MSDRIKDGGPAFPVSTSQSQYTEFGNYGHQDGNTTWQFGGMTLRDWFAGQQLAKITTAYVCDTKASYDRAAEHCYRMADAMLRAREIKPW